jgi:hypothetical protein
MSGNTATSMEFIRFDDLAVQDPSSCGQLHDPKLVLSRNS